MGQSDKLQQWLECQIFQSDFRPVPLSEYYVVDSKMYTKSHEEVFNFTLCAINYHERLKVLVESYFKYKKSVILFWNTKNNWEKYAKKLSAMLEESYETCEGMEDIVTELTNSIYDEIKPIPSKLKIRQNARQEIIKKLSMTNVGLWEILKETIKKGIAYHHSGLTDEERNIVEQGYRDGHLLLIWATSTLSTGINLPAKVVIFNSPHIGNHLIDKTHYKQMSGRAGRTGFDTFGESIMLWDKDNKEHVENVLLKADFNENKLESTIDVYTLRRAILEVIASTSVKSFREIGTFLSKLLKFELLEVEKWQKCDHSYHINKWVYENDDDAAVLMDSELDEVLEQYKQKIIESDQDESSGKKSDTSDEESKNHRISIDEDINPELDCKNWIYDYVFKVLKHLKQKKFLAISHQINDGTILPTPLGKACFASSIPPEEGLQLFKFLFNARLGLQLSSDLHMAYLVTMCMSPLKEPNWLNFSKKLNHLLPDEDALLQHEDISQDVIEFYIQNRPSSYLKNYGGSNLYLDSKKFSQIQEERPQITNSQQTDVDESKQLNRVEVLRKYARFYNALIIQDILKETPINKIADTYAISRGIVQSLQLQAANAGGILSWFWERLHWTDLTVLFMRMNERLTMGVQEELLEIMQIQSLKPEKARILYESGISTLEDVNSTSHEKIFKILMDGECFMSRKNAFVKENKDRQLYISHITSTIKLEASKLLKQIETEGSYAIEASNQQEAFDLEILSDVDDLSEIDESELANLDIALNNTDIINML